MFPLSILRLNLPDRTPLLDKRLVTLWRNQHVMASRRREWVRWTSRCCDYSPNCGVGRILAGMLPRTQASRPRPGPRTCLFLTPRTELMPRTYAHEPTSYILLDPHKSDVNVICQKIKSITNNWNQKTFSDVCKFYPCYNSSQFVSVQFWSINLSYVVWWTALH